ncbi:hypothetical protein [Lutibacter sp.]|uniref:hypothetical protein n=1 Tax=Lutibacter sp. TaxID=1925666 RepID=UPI00349FD813
MKKDRLQIISEGLPLIPRDISKEEQLKMAKKKLDFMHENSGLFISTGEYMMTLSSIKEEIKSLEKEM